MKTIHYFLTACVAILFIGCNSDDDRPQGDMAVFAVPVVKSLSEIRSDVGITAARQTNSDGKIYVAQNHLFYIAQEQGVHIYNNQNPMSPQNAAYIRIPGVHDIAVRGNYLFADNFVDLLVFDISNINSITLVQTLENSISFAAIFPTDAEFYDFTIEAGPGDLVVGYRHENRPRPEGGDITIFAEAMNDALSGAVGQGGSYAKFQINGDALYTIDNFQLNVFNIATPTSTFYDKAVYMSDWFGGGVFETLFLQKEILFVGATNGMHVVDADDEFNPQFVGSFSHATACDPVVVEGAIAYITIRGGSTCGAIEDQVNVIDVANISNPILLSTTFLDQPYGLGVRSNILYVCTASGLKIFDASNPSALVLENSYPESLTDVIPLNSHLISVGPNVIKQYAYADDFSLQLLSTINF